MDQTALDSVWLHHDKRPLSLALNFFVGFSCRPFFLLWLCLLFSLLLLVLLWFLLFVLLGCLLGLGRSRLLLFFASSGFLLFGWLDGLWCSLLKDGLNNLFAENHDSKHPDKRWHLEDEGSVSRQIRELLLQQNQLKTL